MLRIRLSQTGKKHERHFRLIVGEQRSKRDGKNVAQIGYWDPGNKKLEVDKKLYAEWVAKGAQPTQIIRKLLEEGEAVNRK